MYNLINNNETLDWFLREIENKSILALDTETTSLHPKDGQMRLIQISDSENIYIIDCFSFNIKSLAEKLKPLLQNQTVKWIIQNASFEYKWFLYHFGIRLKTVFDTMLASKLISFTDKASLSAIAKRNLGIDLDKTEQRSDWSGELTENQLRYAALDVTYLHELREKQLQDLIRSNQIEAMKLELSATPAISEMELYGISTSTKRFTSLVETNEQKAKEKALELKNFLQTRGGIRNLEKQILQDSLFTEETFFVERDSDINIDSWQQVLPIYREMGVPISSTDKKFMKPLLKEYPDLKYLVDYRAASKLCSTYGRGMLDLISNDRLYPSFKQLGTVTSRPSCDKPNLLNMPSSTDFRSCFKADDSRKLCISDYSQIELRILADFSGDADMINAYNNNVDLHSLTASKIFGIPIEEAKTKYSDLRKAGKILNFALAYGIAPASLVLRLQADGLYDKTEEDAKNMIDGYYDGYKGATRWLFGQERRIVKNPTIVLPAGHVIKRYFDSNDRRAVNTAKRESRNFPIQGCSANITKLALSKIHRILIDKYSSQNPKTLPDAFITNSIYDEIIIDCKEEIAEDVNEILSSEMIRAGEHFIKKVKIEVDAKVCDDWGQKG